MTVVSARLCTVLRNYNINGVSQALFKRQLRTTTCAYLFWESDFKGGYNKDRPKYSVFHHIREGYRQLKVELELFKQEIIEKFRGDPILVFRPGIIDKQWEVHSPQDIENWVVTSDSDHGEGQSSCQFVINEQGNGLFCGNLDVQVPKDGKIKRAGYCTIRTKRARKSFKRNAYLNWTPYTHLVLRLRGDGRSYMLIIATTGYFDQLWNDTFHYVLYTRGGPYWQTTKIPFSKFFFTNKGRVQDLQNRISLDRVTNFGITAADKINGPFSLEIDYIGLEYDPSHTEEFAYEMYQLPKNIAAT